MKFMIILALGFLAAYYIILPFVASTFWTTLYSSVWITILQVPLHGGFCLAVVLSLLLAWKIG